MRRGFLKPTYWKEEFQDLPEPGASVKTEVLVNYEKGIWNIVQKPAKNTKLFHATWKYPTVRLWRKLRKYNESYEQESKGWKHLLLGCSFIDGITLEGGELSLESYRKIMNFYPGMIPASLMQKYLATTYLSTREDLRIERECFQLWTTESSSLKNPHPILADVLWSMSMYERFGIQMLGNMDDLHVKVYAVMRKALECHSQSQGINIKAQEARRRALEMTGVRPGGFVGRR